jgi:hypothetical protein
VENHATFVLLSMMGENIAQLNAIQKNETQNDFEE